MSPQYPCDGAFVELWNLDEDPLNGPVSKCCSDHARHSLRYEPGASECRECVSPNVETLVCKVGVVDDNHTNRGVVPAAADDVRLDNPDPELRSELLGRGMDPVMAPSPKQIVHEFLGTQFDDVVFCDRPQRAAPRGGQHVELASNRRLINGREGAYLTRIQVNRPADSRILTAVNGDLSRKLGHLEINPE